MAIDPECDSRFDAIFEIVSRTDVAIRGNGKPGLNIRMDRCERAIADVSKMKWLVVAAVTVALFSSIF